MDREETVPGHSPKALLPKAKDFAQFKNGRCFVLAGRRYLQFSGKDGKTDFPSLYDQGHSRGRHAYTPSAAAANSSSSFASIRPTTSSTSTFSLIFASTATVGVRVTKFWT